MLFKTSFSDNEIHHYVDLTASFIKTQKEAFHQLGTPLSTAEQETLKPFFSEGILHTTRFFLKTDGPIESPDFITELNERGILFTLDMLKAVTFQDVIVAYEPLDAKVQFHELVHAVQYQKMGLKQFANRYVRGLFMKGSYEGIPLEVNARLLEQAFTRNSSEPFSVEQEVQRWINENRF